MDTLTRMQAFVDIVDAGGFSAAARKVGRSKALMSKYVRELEDELGILLLNRTTRQFSLTESGQVFHASAIEILQKVNDLQDKVREAGNGQKGRLKISAPRSFTDLEIGLPIVEFASAFPDITLDIDLDDAMVDMVEDGFDVAIRVSRLSDSSLIAKKLAEFKLVVCASPDFIEQYGTPKQPQDVCEVPCIVDTNMKRRANWLFVDEEGQEYSVPVRGSIEVNSPEVARRAALAGLGLTMAPEFAVEEELRSGKLVSVLEEHVPTGAGIYVVYPHRRHVPGKVRAFVDFLTEWFKKKRASA